MRADSSPDQYMDCSQYQCHQSRIFRQASEVHFPYFGNPPNDRDILLPEVSIGRNSDRDLINIYIFFRQYVHQRSSHHIKCKIPLSKSLPPRTQQASGTGNSLPPGNEMTTTCRNKPPLTRIFSEGLTGKQSYWDQ